MEEEQKQNNLPRREFVKKAVYVAPVILTLAVAPRYAKAGSEKPGGPPQVTEPPSTKDPAAWWAWLLKLLGLA